MKSSINVGNEANEYYYGICKLIPHAQHALVYSICPLPENLMIGVVGQNKGINISCNSKVQMKKQMLDMLCESHLIKV